MRHAIRQIHFVGIGGSGMSGIAEVLHNQGYTISGSDINESAAVRRLRDLGIDVIVGHRAENILGADCMVISTAIDRDNPEIIAARAHNIPIVSRAVMLAELMRMKQGIAIAGTHGKTTTTSLVACILAAEGLDPTFVIGGKLNSAGVNAKLGRGDYIVVEADESDASFLNLLPMISVVTNIDADHMDTYDHDLSKLKSAFLEFLHRMPFYGAAVVCGDDAGVRSVVEQIARPVITYGFNEGVQVRAISVQAKDGRMQFVVDRKKAFDLPDLHVTLNLAGRHNVLNALAAIAVACELEISDTAITTALLEFKGVSRRFQHYGHLIYQDKRFDLIDDYGHHPVEMQATIEAARGAYSGRRLLLVFQPHRYSRTRDCFEDFVKVLGSADAVLLADVYAAGEDPIIASDGRALARALRVAGKVEPVFVDEITEMPKTVLAAVQDGDVVICMGAGSIGGVSAQIKALLEE